MGQLTQTDTAQPELSVHRLGAPTALAPAVTTHGELGLT